MKRRYEKGIYNEIIYSEIVWVSLRKTECGSRMLTPMCGVTRWASHTNPRMSRYMPLWCDCKCHGFPKWRLLHFNAPHKTKCNLLWMYPVALLLETSVFIQCLDVKHKVLESENHK